MISSSIAGLAAVDWGGEFGLPPINHLFEFPAFPFSRDWEIFGISMAISRTQVVIVLATLLAALLFLLAFRKASVVPGKLQSAVESIVEFIRERIAIEIIGPEGLRYVPLLTTVFVFIFFNNLMKITPFVMFPPTSRIALPFFLALISWLVFVGAGFRNQGVVGYLKGVAFPPGVPWPAYILLTPIELISNFVLRPFTLAIRLFANMVAGHILVVITLITIHVFLHPAQGATIPIGVLGLIASPLVFGFELMIISLQAYIFTMLTAVYISSAVHAEH